MAYIHDRPASHGWRGRHYGLARPSPTSADRSMAAADQRIVSAACSGVSPALSVSRHLVGAGRRIGAPVGQPGDPVLLVAAQPVAQRLESHPVAACHVDDGGTVHHLDHCLWRYSTNPNSTSTGDQGRDEPTSRTLGCQAGTGASVAREPNPCPRTVVYLPNRMLKACTELAHCQREQREHS